MNGPSPPPMEGSSHITFVSTFMTIYPPDSPYATKDVRWRFDRFFHLLETGIHLCVYVDPTGEELLRQCVELFPDTLKLMRVVRLQDTWVHKLCEQYDTVGLPATRNEPKDTYEYMVLMHSKVEFLHDTAQQNPWGSTHFAWIDFNITHVFKDLVGSQAFLRGLATSRLAPSYLLVPGCWSSPTDPLTDEGVWDKILGRIHWRFCGGFFLGDRASVIEFRRCYVDHFPEFLFKYRQMTWEVNFWAWLEWAGHWSPTWFLADHDDCMIRIPAECMSLCLARDVGSYRAQTYTYPSIPDFVPMSASVTVLPDGRIGMNTRCVNYRLAPNGSYIFHHPDRVIITRNLFSVLDPETLVPGSYDEMANPTELESRACPFDGVEDIRIWSEPADGTVRFVGTSINYAPSDRARIITGVYDTGARRLTEATVVEPPTPTSCEKNWSPVVRGHGNSTRYIYRWSPLEVGHFEEGSGSGSGSAASLVIDTTRALPSPLVKRWRGSTYFREHLTDPSLLVGVVHFSEKEWPRNYYHQLVLLDKATLQPVKCSQPFSFAKPCTIEFCIGFLAQRGARGGEDQYHFWISQFDRDPLQVTVAVADLPFCITLS